MNPPSDSHRAEVWLLFVCIAEQERAQAPGQLVLLELACRICLCIVLSEDQRQSLGRREKIHVSPAQSIQDDAHGKRKNNPQEGKE